ncbi:hypothetical protein ASD83_06720 [Devosia sp. Root685]|uniref:DUF1697 domain-containing protein n=1 Tax=Devosia sp. Root685 TaxID=1736587 RepID=UPI0006F808A8|nr:DUF1697 domain-containing protein [Devosia sp. Root685]KRB01209.1 hypothetical protein ASD83_06720 [Devosia sp. Root685]
MAPNPSTYVILLRAIGPVTHKLMSMTQWREAAVAAGFVAPETLVNTGNMIAGFDGTEAAVVTTTVGVLRSFGLGENVVPVVRKPALLHKLMQADPIAEAAAERPNQTGVYFFASKKPDFDWLKRYDGPETVHVVHDHLIVDFTQDVGQSGRLIRQIDKNCGTNTSRNWNSVRRIADRCAARENA